MDTAEDLKKWFIKMGYTGKLPTDLSSICNVDTAALWNDVMNKVKPCAEVARIRNDIVIDHFKNDSCTKKDAEHPIKEIRMWAKRKELEKQVAFVKDQISYKETEITHLENKNKMKYLSMENTRKKIEQHRQYSYLLHLKAKSLQKQLDNVKDMLNTVTNLTPVNSDGENEAGVIDTLNQCTEQLKKLIENNQQSPCNSVCSSELLDDQSFDFNNILTSSPIVQRKFFDHAVYKQLVNGEKTLDPMTESLLYRCPRQNIWIGLKEANLLQQKLLLQVVTRSGDCPQSSQRKDDASLTILYAKHVDCELKIVELRLKTDRLENELRLLRDNIFMELSEKCPSSSFDVQSAIEVKQKEVQLQATAKFLSEAIHSLQLETNAEHDLLKLNTDVKLLDEGIGSTLESIRRKHEVIKQLRADMLEMSDRHSMEATKLRRFTTDLVWIQPLLYNAVTEEINTFLQYPLDYNNKLNDLQYNLGENLDTNVLLMLGTLTTNVWSPPEVLLINLVKAKRKLAVLKSLKAIDDNLKDYTFAELDYQESYINYALDKIKSLIYSGGDTEQRLKTVRKVIDLWLEMPFKTFISPNRTFNDLNYEHYEHLYERYYELV